LKKSTILCYHPHHLLYDKPTPLHQQDPKLGHYCHALEDVKYLRSDISRRASKRVKSGDTQSGLGVMTLVIGVNSGDFFLTTTYLRDLWGQVLKKLLIHQEQCTLFKSLLQMSEFYEQL